MIIKSSATAYGAFFALCAAMLNASIGTFSKVLILNGLSPSAIAFGKTLLGAIILFGLMPFINAKLAGKWYQVVICAFFGIFIMYMFETKAYEFETAANVVVALMASACVSAIILGRLLLGEKIRLTTIVGSFFAISGLAVIVGVKFGLDYNVTGLIFGVCAGTGYGAFSVIMKKYELQGGLILTRQMLMYGAIFLFIPVSFDYPLHLDLSYPVILSLIFLAVLPTILGFCCTTKAIQYLTPSKVQIIELSEPIFAALIAFVFLREVPGVSTYIGGALIIFGISIANGLLHSPAYNVKKALNSML